MAETVDHSLRETEISQMIRKIEKVDDPLQVVDVSQVIEFTTEAPQRGGVVMVAQAQMASTDMVSIRTDNLDKCVVGILKIPSQDGNFRIFLVHIQDGDLQANAEGNKEQDVRAVLQPNSQAIFIHSDRSYATGQSTARILAYSDLTTQKIINPHGGNSLIDVVYRPTENKIFVRVKSSTFVQVFEGFKER